MKKRGKISVTKKKLTLEGLATHLDKRFENIENSFDSQIETLAISTQNQFGEMQKQADRNTKLMLDQFKLIRDDLSDIKTTTRSLVSSEASQDKELKHLDLRVSHLERKSGFAHA